MTTESGTVLTDHEESCVKALKRLVNKWNKEPNRLWLFSASGTLHVMMKECETNQISELTGDAFYGGGGVNPENVVWSTRDIQNDGGDW